MGGLSDSVALVACSLPCGALVAPARTGFAGTSLMSSTAHIHVRRRPPRSAPHTARTSPALGMRVGGSVRAAPVGGWWAGVELSEAAGRAGAEVLSALEGFLLGICDRCKWTI